MTAPAEGRPVYPCCEGARRLEADGELRAGWCPDHGLSVPPASSPPSAGVAPDGEPVPAEFCAKFPACQHTPGPSGYCSCCKPAPVPETAPGKPGRCPHNWPVGECDLDDCFDTLPAPSVAPEAAPAAKCPPGSVNARPHDHLACLAETAPGKPTRVELGTGPQCSRAVCSHPSWADNGICHTCGQNIGRKNLTFPLPGRAPAPAAEGEPPRLEWKAPKNMRHPQDVAEYIVNRIQLMTFQDAVRTVAGILEDVMRTQSAEQDSKPAGEPPEDHSKHEECAWPDEPCNQLTFADAMALDPSQVETCLAPEGGPREQDWLPLDKNKHLTLASLRMYTFRLKPQPAPALTRVQEMAKEAWQGGLGKLGGTVADAEALIERVVNAVCERFQDFGYVLMRDVEHIKREFLEPLGPTTQGKGQ